MPELPPEAEELVQALQSELQAARRERADMRELRQEVAELREQIASLQALPPATPERVDEALEAELREGQAPPEHPPAAPEEDDAPTPTSTGGPGAADGALVRAAVSAARWLEKRLGRARRR